MHKRANIPIIYVINLSSRLDRREKVTNTLAKLGLEFNLVPAVDANELKSRNLSFVLPIAAQACWDSHLLAMQAFLETTEPYALIFEDDVELRKWKNVKSLLNCLPAGNFDLVQLGFVNTGLIDRIHRYLKNLESTIFQVLYEISKRDADCRLSTRLRVSRRSDMGFKLVADDIRAGAQAYLISRRLTQTITTSCQRPMVPIDGLFMSLGWTTKYKMARTLFNCIPQDNSPSSIKGFA